MTSTSTHSASSGWTTPILVVVLSAAAIFALTLGARMALALYIGPINSATGLGLASISLAFGVGQLMWGITQPIGGALADRYGNAPVLVAGILMVALGLALTPYAHTLLTLTLAIGVLGAGGAGIAGPAILMSAVNRQIPPERRGMANGIVNAGGSFGQFTILPLAVLLIDWQGWSVSLLWLAAVSLLAIPLSVKLWLPGTAQQAAGGVAGGVAAGVAKTTPAPTMKAALKTALADRSFLCLSAGFFVCGFHVAFIATHLPGVVALCGLPPAVGAWSLGIIGLFNIVGSLGIGWAVGRWRSKSLLSLLYTARALAVVVFMLAPKTATSFFIFAAVIGVTYLSTVPPTAGLVGKLYGPRYMATLFGIVMLSHQVGGFLGAVLGGMLYERSGSYDAIWYADIALALFAAVIHLPIREAAMRPLAVPA